MRKWQKLFGFQICLGSLAQMIEQIKKKEKGNLTRGKFLGNRKMAFMSRHNNGKKKMKKKKYDKKIKANTRED